MPVNVNEPRRGDIFLPGERITVEWENDTRPHGYLLRCSHTGGRTFVGDPARAPAGASSCAMELPAVAAELVVVRVMALDAAGEITAQADSGYFTVLPAGSSLIRVTSPSDGDRFFPGDTIVVKWRTIGAVAFHEVRLSTDGGATFVLVSGVLSAAADEFTWKVPTAIVGDDIFRVIGKDAAGKVCAKGTSRGYFTIEPAPTETSVKVLRPGGGEAFRPGEQVKIEWHTSGPVAAHEVRLSLDGGASFSRILEETDLPAAAQSFLFTVPDSPTADAQIRVIAKDAAGLIVSDGDSEGEFAIVGAEGAPPKKRKVATLLGTGLKRR